MQPEQDKNVAAHEEDSGAAGSDPEPAASAGAGEAGGPGGESASTAQMPPRERRVARAGPPAESPDSASSGGPIGSPLAGRQVGQPSEGDVRTGSHVDQP